jgi:tRNA 2-selenouridine synthase
VWVEAESSKIGQVHLPNELWQAMKAAGGVELEVSTAERADYLLRTYRHFVEDPDELKRLVRRLRHRLSESVVGGWVAAIDAGRWEEFVADVLEMHYDPAYRHSRDRDFPNVRESLTVDSLGDDGVRRVAAELRAFTSPVGAPARVGAAG